ncbi:glucokinase [Phaeobacter sp. QD34_3]|uniref:glucokinase n=1 Tax=unclassified Phaeobacter TaxID=2621772 RepID=UPI00237F8D57|nr:MULTISPECIES: glucokinase [unclassified Phaeobacter]MDE4131509.1 glucokinase [Phaeobacter sp. QD34_3]MDE4135402.1 glucokinase [Phaeobacter sp. QD34_24]
MTQDLTVLVGDVGGSNTRLALAGAEIGVTGLKHFANDGFASLDDVLAAYCRQPDMPPLHGCCLAVAGPVYGDAYRLTNRDWQGTAADLASALPLEPGGQVHVVNDLAALGHALPVLMPGQLSSLRPGRQTREQALVAGVGTGFNVALSVAGRTIEAELGHASLPEPVVRELTRLLHRDPKEFPSVEELFSGRGLVRLHSAMGGDPSEGGAEIVAAFEAGATHPAQQSVTAWARLLGLFARELVPAYMPGQGIFFAGSVARGVLCTDARTAFLSAFAEPQGKLADRCAALPLWLITDDAAGVSGTARYALEAAKARLGALAPA